MKKTIYTLLLLFICQITRAYSQEDVSQPKEKPRAYVRFNPPITTFGTSLPSLTKFFLGLGIGIDFHERYAGEVSVGLGFGYSLQGVGRYYLTKKGFAQPYVSLGGAYYDGSIDIGFDDDNDSTSYHGPAIMAGVGLRWFTKKHFSMNSQIYVNTVFADRTTKGGLSGKLTTSSEIMVFPMFEIAGLEFRF